MNLPNTLTLLRIIFAPVFFVLYWIPIWTGFYSPVLYAILWLVFLFIEVTDIIDGHIARKMGLVTDLGKLLDPFSDVISRLTYFVSFVAFGVMHPVFCLLILYREFGIVFIRMILAQRGIALAAKSGGKIKSVFYAIAAAAGLTVTGLHWFMNDQSLLLTLQRVTDGIFAVSAALAIISFVQYFLIFLNKVQEKDG